MEVGESPGEFELFSVDCDGAMRGLPSLRGFSGEIITPNREEPTNLRLFKFQKTGHLAVVGNMQFMMLHASEYPDQHVEEVDADIGGDPAGFAYVPFPGGEVPVPPGGDVGEIDGILFPCRGLPDLLPQSHDGRMDPELEDVVDPLPRFPFQFGEGIQVPGVEDERFFANRIGTDAKCKSHVGIVKIVGRADADIVNALVASLPAQLFSMPVESLKLSEEGYVEEIAVHDADGIGFVQCGNELVFGIAYCLHVARCYISRCSDQGKVLWR